ncbi:MAG TPA: 2,3-diaminopropionate biosynthesis protein SbnA [Solirubrobacteraceae bacterium]|jgi:cysteine synthase A|nr:2,3-diaminopropionate biosynthesis protein SbnA [Solirubrobacteraceae bacterium]
MGTDIRCSRDAGVLASIGETPLIRLARLYEPVPLALYAKLEGNNPAGSMKDRSAYAIISAAIARGEVVPGHTVVVESSSGNFAIGLAQICKYYGITIVCVVDPKTSATNLAILKAFGAELDMVDGPDIDTDEYLPARLARVAQLEAELDNAYRPDQYSNILAAQAHQRTMAEIVERLDGEVDYLFCATSTCATLRGCAEYVAQRQLNTHIVAVDAVGSTIFDGPHQPRLIPGHGAAICPDLYAPGLADEVVYVTDRDCVVGCRRLMDREAYLAGGSSGGVVAAFGAIRERLATDARCVLIFADRGERYLDTIYNDSWVAAHFDGLAQSFAASGV